MRIYAIEDLYEEQVEIITNKLDEMGYYAGLEGTYFLPVPENLLDEEQKEHADECGPHVYGIEVEYDKIRLELLIRAKSKIRCSCVKYANPEQRLYAIEYLDKFIKDLDIPV